MSDHALCVLAMTMATASLTLQLFSALMQARRPVAAPAPLPVTIPAPIAPKPVSRKHLKVRELRRLASTLGVGTSTLRQSGRKADLIRVLEQAGVSTYA